MTITFIGNFEVPYSSESHYLRTFRKLGHEVIALQENNTNKQEILDHALHSDMLFHVHTHGPNWVIEGLEDVYEILKVNNIPTVGYHLDLWKGLQREGDLQNDKYWNIEYFFTADKNFVPDLEKRGIKAYYLPAGVVEDECYLGTPREEFKHDVIFVGSKGYHSEWPYRSRLINWLQETYGDRFAHYGGDGKGTIRDKDLNDLYASAKVVVGDTLCIGFDYPNYFSDRLFEATGRGAFMIFPYIKGIENLFKIASPDADPNSDTELMTYEFGHFELLELMINMFVSPFGEAGRELIRMNGHNRTKRDHTYSKRLQFILDTIQNESSI